MQMKISSNQKLFAGYIIFLVEQMYLRNNEYLSSNCDKKRNLNKGQLIKELSKIMFEFNILNDCLSINKAQQSKLYKKLSIKLDEMFNDEYLTERDCIKEILSNCAKDSYYINSFVTSIGISYTLKPVSNSILQKIIKHKIDGKMWSDRLWENKKNLRKDLKVQVKKFLNGEINVNEISNILEKKYSNNKYVTKRLVNNEISLVQNMANDVWNKNHNVNYVMWDATLDNKTCNDCGSLDGKVFPSDDIPYDGHKHVLCRCCTIPLVNKDWKPTYRRDNLNKTKIQWTDYETWKKDNL